MMATAPAAHELERRKRVKLRLRKDIEITPQRYEGRVFYVVKDPVSLRYYRFKEQEHFLLGYLDGAHTLEEAQKAYEKHFRPERLTLEDLESFAQQLISAGLAQNESPRAGKQLVEQRNKRKRSEWMQTLTNILYIKIPIFDPDRLLVAMLKYCRFIFTFWFFTLSIVVMGSALMLVATHFETFQSKLPSYHEFFSLKTVVYLWIALAVVKVIHEFGHGLSCRVFGGEVHEMGLLFLVFSPAMYCNVSDSWTLPSKWKRIIISAAGIYVELIIASISTFVWWNTPAQPFVNNMALSLMVVCSVSTIVFNANPLMRYDGYYVLADWIEIPNLRERANRYLQNLFLEHCLGIEVQPEPYMALWRRSLFLIYSVVSWVYRWAITYFILVFIYNFLQPYKLGVVSGMLAIASLASMVGWPLWRLGQNIQRRGRLPDMKPMRVTITVSVFLILILLFFLLPLPVSNVHAVGLVQVDPNHSTVVSVPNDTPLVLEKIHIKDGEKVQKGKLIAEFSSRELTEKMKQAETKRDISKKEADALRAQSAASRDTKIKADYDQRAVAAEVEQKRSDELVRQCADQLKRVCEIRAPQDGYIMGAPTVDLIGKRWDPARPVCTVGDPDHLIVRIGVSPADYNLIDQDLKAERKKQKEGEAPATLPATMRVQGRDSYRWRGEISDLPQSQAEYIPLALSSKAGGPIAVKPGESKDRLVPQAQQYLVSIRMVEPDAAIQPGSMARVKVHCRSRSCAWWCWRTINDTFNLGLGWQ